MKREGGFKARLYSGRIKGTTALTARGTWTREEFKNDDTLLNETGLTFEQPARRGMTKQARRESALPADTFKTRGFLNRNSSSTKFNFLGVVSAGQQKGRGLVKGSKRGPSQREAGGTCHRVCGKVRGRTQVFLSRKSRHQA